MSQAGDPFFDVLRVLQPDVDIVVLPPDDPTGVITGGPADAAAAERATATVMAMLLDEAGLGASTTHPRAVFERWQRLRDDAHLHRRRTRVEHDDPSAALDSLLRVRDVLHEADWAPTPVDSPTPWFIATSPTGVDVEVTAEGAWLVLTVGSAPMRLDRDPR